MEPTRDSDEEELDVDGSEGYESAGGQEIHTEVLHEEYVEVEEEEEEEGEQGGAAAAAGGNGAEQPDAPAGSTSSSGSEEEEGNEASSGTSSDEQNEGEEDDDIFGPGNEDYVRTPAQSRFSIPVLPPLPPQEFKRGGGRDEFRRGSNRGEDRNSCPPYSGAFLQQGGYKARDMLAAELKFGAVGHQDETLRVNCAFQEPREIACYSHTADGKVHFDDRCLRQLDRNIFRPYDLNIDLNEGYDSFVEKRADSEANAFRDLLECIRRTPTNLQDIHFVSFRNNFNKLLGTAYNRRDPWEMGVHKRRGTVYLDVRKGQEAPQTAQQQRMCYWGHKFEQVASEPYMQSGVLDSLDDGAYQKNVVVDANIEFCSVVRTKLGPHRIIMGAEIDCFDIGSDGKRRYTELKTSRTLDQRTAERFEREKLLKFWIQSFLAGVPRIVCGYRDDNGILKRAEMMVVREIAHKMKQKQNWEGGVCLAFADRILCWLYGSVQDDGDYILRFLPMQNGKLELWKAESCSEAINHHVQQLNLATH